ncbi:DUF1707 SHOCT-like domain-containing protein [Propionimicrobium lymphophilum]|uniref:DUF1707 SHOCT-like domain-containing protein n=1 Tax=Propionimicrobium lymphophilum TaxID=33012 RepID=UPI0023F4C361|nr:DUF1707 domain-containing protein [Propionimicrobium lymphophilum]
MPISDDERRDAQAKLSAAYANKMLSDENFNRRVERVWNTQDPDELSSLIGDLNQDAYQWPLVQDSHRADEVVGRSYGPPISYQAGPGGDERGYSVGILSGQYLVGPWVCPPRHVTISAIGGCEIDLRYAKFQSQEVEISCWNLMGGTEITVPPEMQVSIKGVGIMGGFGWKKPQMASPWREAPEGSPRITITGLALMAGVEVIRKER